MTDFNYGDIIEYIDETYDENFNSARRWAREHNTTFDELMDMRDLPKRYFKIGEEYKPTVEEKKNGVRFIRNSYLSKLDFTQLDDSPFSEGEKEQYRKYRQYLRNYTENENWWESLPLTFEQWNIQ